MHIERYEPPQTPTRGEYIQREPNYHDQQTNGFIVASERLFYVFGVGIVAIVLNAIYHSWQALQTSFDVLIYRGFIVAVIFSLALLGGFLFLKFEQKTKANIWSEPDNEIDQIQEQTDNDFFIMPRMLQEGTPAFNDAVIDRFNYLHSVGRYSKTRLAMDVFKKKGIFYERKLSEILEEAGESL